MILIRDAAYVVRDADTVERDCDVLIDGCRIAAVGRGLEAGLAPGSVITETIDGRDRAVIPGLVNAHSHLYQNFLKGLRDDVGLVEWCDTTLYPMAFAIHRQHWLRHDETCGYQWAVLSALEMIRGGVTCAVDMNMNMDAVFHGWQDVGHARRRRHRPVGPLAARRAAAAAGRVAGRGGAAGRAWHGADPLIDTVMAPPRHSSAAASCWNGRATRPARSASACRSTWRRRDTRWRTSGRRRA